MTPVNPPPATAPPVLAVAVSTAVLFGALAARVHPGLVLAAACWLGACAVPLAFIDAVARRLPDRLTIPAYAGTAALLLAAAAVSGHWPVLLRAALGGLALAGFYLALLLISPSAMGLGDVKLAASLGTLLAWFGWRTLIADWEQEAARHVAMYRAAMTVHLDDPAWTALPARLAQLSPDFARFWASSDVAGPERRLKRFRHPSAGPLTFHSTSLLMADDPMIRIVILYPATAPDAARLERLAR